MCGYLLMVISLRHDHIMVREGEIKYFLLASCDCVVLLIIRIIYFGLM